MEAYITPELTIIHLNPSILLAGSQGNFGIGDMTDGPAF